jgi:hypothetical protein
LTRGSFPCNYKSMEDEKNIYSNIIKNLAAKTDNLERMVFQLTTLNHTMHQTIKQMMFMISKGAEPFNSAPKGERDTVLCEGCGARIFIRDALKKTKIVGDTPVIFTNCRKCFYGRRETV